LILICWAALAFLPLVFEHFNRHWWNVLCAAAPGGAAAIAPRMQPADVELGAAERLDRVWSFAVAALVSHAALAGWFVRRYGRMPAVNRPLAEAKPAVAPRAWLGSPRSRPFTAILWKQWRESAPLAALAAAAVVAAAIVFASYNAWKNEPEALTIVVAASTACWGAVGIFVAVVAGIGVFMDDMHPRLHAFWRSRPVDVNQWFIVKFAAGMAITMVILAAPPFLIGALALLMDAELPPDAAHDLKEFALAMLMAQACIYSVAGLAMVLVRQAIYAAILTIAAVGVFLAATDYVADGNPWPLTLFGGVAAAAASAVLAWVAVRRDWGWKG
jgi:hypothetical protein